MELVILREILFGVVVLMSVAGAILVAVTRSIVHSVFGLLLALCGVAGIYLFLGADFVGISQLLIYVGGVVVLLLFAVMLTGGFHGGFSFNNPAMGSIPALLFSLAFFLITIYVILQLPLSPREIVYDEPTAAPIGNMLLGEQVLAFEFASLLVVAVLIGSLLLIRKESQDPLRDDESIPVAPEEESLQSILKKGGDH